jgi:uncharacterized membrane protein SpoIIM required for sporulation
MTPALFLQTRSQTWDTLEQLVDQAQRRGIKALDEQQLHQLTHIYPAVVVDVARARLYDLDPTTQKRINQLAINAHGLLYRRKARRPLHALWRFFRMEYPQLFRRLWPYVVLSLVLFGMGSSGAYVSTRLRPSNAYLFVPSDMDMADMQPGVSARDISERFRKMPNAPMATGIMTNNIRVAFVAFAFGISAGIGTCYILFVNAMMLGGFAGHFANHDLLFDLWCFLAPHGVLEIFAILVAGGAGLRLGLSLAIPGDLKRSASLRQGAKEAVLLVLGTIPMFVVAGLIEGFITPSHLPGPFKIALGLAAGGMTVAYLLMVGHGRMITVDSRS